MLLNIMDNRSIGQNNFARHVCLANNIIVYFSSLAVKVLKKVMLDKESFATASQ